MPKWIAVVLVALLIWGAAENPKATREVVAAGEHVAVATFNLAMSAGRVVIRAIDNIDNSI